MGSTDQMSNPDEFAVNWDALVTSTVDHAKHANEPQISAPTNLFPAPVTTLDIKRVTFEEFMAYHPAELAS